MLLDNSTNSFLLISPNHLNPVQCSGKSACLDSQGKRIKPLINQDPYLHTWQLLNAFQINPVQKRLVLKKCNKTMYIFNCLLNIHGVTGAFGCKLSVSM